MLAAVGTALPETLLPLVAILSGHDTGEEIGTGAILGAPFMLTTLAMVVIGVAVLVITTLLTNTLPGRAAAEAQQTATPAGIPAASVTMVPFKVGNAGGKVQITLDPGRVGLNSVEAVVYGGTGKAARNWPSFDAICRTLTTMALDETLLVQSGKPVGVLRTHEWAPRVLIANSNLVGDWATWPAGHGNASPAARRMTK